MYRHLCLVAAERQADLYQKAAVAEAEYRGHLEVVVAEAEYRDHLEVAEAVGEPLAATVVVVVHVQGLMEVGGHQVTVAVVEEHVVCHPVEQNQVHEVLEDPVLSSVHPSIFDTWDLVCNLALLLSIG